MAKVSSSASVLDHTALNRILDKGMIKNKLNSIQFTIQFYDIPMEKRHLDKFQMKLDLHQLKLFKRVTSTRTNQVKGYGHVSHWYKKNRAAVKVNQNASSTLLHFAGLRDLELQQCL